MGIGAPEMANAALKGGSSQAMPLGRGASNEICLFQFSEGYAEEQFNRHDDRPGIAFHEW